MRRIDGQNHILLVWYLKLMAARRMNDSIAVIGRRHPDLFVGAPAALPDPCLLP